MDWLRIYFDFIGGIFDYLTLKQFTPLKNKNYNPKYKNVLFILYLLFTVLYAIPSHIPFGLFISNIVEFLYIFLMSNKKLKFSLFQFVKFNIYTLIATVVFTFLHSFLLNDYQYLDIDTYTNYKSLTCFVSTYVTLCLYTYIKRISALRSFSSIQNSKKKHYGIGFCIAIALSVFVLSSLSLLLLSNADHFKHMLPVIFSLIFVIIAICLTAYNQVLHTLEENTRQELQLSKYELETAYYQNIKNSMDTFRSARHDFKNHLIILNGYAQNQEFVKLQEYLAKISTPVADSQIIQTPHELISAILNAKAISCKQQNIQFQCDYNFSKIYISDYHLVTILGNILDNAITAAGKLQNGFVSIHLKQTEAYLTIFCKNNHREHIKETNGVFLSTKENPGIFHGLGLKNVQTSVDTLNGTLKTQYDSSSFSITILLPNYSATEN